MGLIVRVQGACWVHNVPYEFGDNVRLVCVEIVRHVATLCGVCKLACSPIPAAAFGPEDAYQPVTWDMVLCVAPEVALPVVRPV